MKWQIGVLSLLTMLIGINTARASSIKGSVVFDGTAPSADEIKMNADPSCMAAHGGTAVKGESVIINDNGTLQNVFVHVKDGIDGSEYSAPKEAATLDQKGCQYIPHVLGVMTKQPIEIINSDDTLHNVHAMPENSKPFNLGMPIKGMKLKKSFDKAEVMVKVKCDVHPWMATYIGVVDHPFFSTTDNTGSFSINDLPAGTYEIEAWHEKYGTQTQEVTVGDDEVKEITFTFSA